MLNRFPLIQPSTFTTTHMATTETTTTTTKRGRGRPRKLNPSSLEVNSTLSAAVERALAQVLNGASVKEVVKQPLREPTASDYDGTLILSLPKKQGKERLIIGRRKTNFRSKAYDFVDLRTFYFAADVDKWLPTTKGVTFPYEQLDSLIDALKVAAKQK